MGVPFKVCLVHQEHTFVCFIQVRWRSLNFQFVLDTPPKARHGHGTEIQAGRRSSSMRARRRLGWEYDIDIL